MCSSKHCLINIVLKKGGEFPINNCMSYIWTTVLTNIEYVYKICLLLFKKVLEECFRDLLNILYNTLNSQMKRIPLT